MKKVHNECAKCEKEGALYQYEGQELCFDCLLKEINIETAMRAVFDVGGNENGA